MQSAHNRLSARLLTRELLRKPGDPQSPLSLADGASSIEDEALLTVWDKRHLQCKSGRFAVRRSCAEAGGDHTTRLRMQQLIASPMTSLAGRYRWRLSMQTALVVSDSLRRLRLWSIRSWVIHLPRSVLAEIKHPLPRSYNRNFHKLHHAYH
jgi:hypothetical protein